MYDRFTWVNSIFRRIAAHLPRVLEMGSEQDCALYAEMDAAAASFANLIETPHDSSTDATPDTPSNTPPSRNHVQLHLNREGLKQEKVELLDCDFARVRDTVKDCSCVTFRAFNTEVDHDTWQKLHRLFQAFPSLQDVRLDCALGPSRTYAYSHNGSDVLEKPSRAAGGGLGHRQISRKVVPEAARAAHRRLCIPTPLNPPPGVETLILEMSEAQMESLGWNFSKFGIGAAVRAGICAPAPQLGGGKAKKTIIFRTDTRERKYMFWWDETKKVCDKYGVQLVLERMPRTRM
ncbi:hypothetical protein C8Q74DRAFT_1215069 [Fomes fomentarius]|nr:hypothetical protein C8Q74DRAFT_1215069 [Fomes fomentarius]